MVSKYFEPNPCSSAGTPGYQKSLRGQAYGVVKICPTNKKLDCLDDKMYQLLFSGLFDQTFWHKLNSCTASYFHEQPQRTFHLQGVS